MTTDRYLARTRLLVFPIASDEILPSWVEVRGEPAAPRPVPHIDRGESDHAA